MRRIDLIDGLRGYFLLFMFLNHLTFAGGYLLVRVNHAELGFVQDAQGFVFLSGLLVGAIYSRRMLRHGFAAGAAALWRRALELYAHTIGCMVLVLLLREMLPRAPELWRAWLGEFGDGDRAFQLAGAVLLYQTTYLDILPQYIVYLLAAPPLVLLCVTGRWLSVAIGSALLWAAVQTGLHLPFADAINAGLAWIQPDLFMRVPFNVLGWQVLFVGGIVFGSLWAQDRLPLGKLFGARSGGLLKTCVVVLAFFLIFRLAFTFEIVPDAVMRRFQVYENRPEFGPVFLVNFVALAYALAWLLIAGPQSERRPVTGAARLLTWLFSLPFLRLLGRHSLQIYAWHVVLIYLVLWLDGYAGPFGELAKTTIALAGVASLAAPAFVVEWRENRRARLAVGRDAA